MISDEKLREIASGLLEKSRASKVEWQAGDSGEYWLKLPQSIVEIDFCVPRSGADWAELRLRNLNGAVVGNWRAEDYIESTDDFKLLKDLYSEAHRVVTGWDKVLDDVQQYILSK